MNRFVFPMLSALMLFNASPCFAQASKDAPDAAQTAAMRAVRVRGDRLVFDTVESYKSLVDNPSESVKTRFLGMLDSLNGFKSYEKNAGQDRGIQDPYFGSMLNVELAVQIGEHMFRVNPWEERVYALSSSHESEYDDLISENTSNPHVLVFSTGDDVLKMLAANDTPNTEASLFHGWHPFQHSNPHQGWKIFCTESGCGGDDKSTAATAVDNGNFVTVSGDIHYNKYGLFFSLFAKVGYSGVSNPNNYQFYISLDPVRYHVRCGSTVGPYVVTDYTSSMKYQSYQGSTPLNAVHFRAKFKVRNVVVPHTWETGWIEIKKNY